jgi:hypothetical protein
LGLFFATGAYRLATKGHTMSKFSRRMARKYHGQLPPLPVTIQQPGHPDRVVKLPDPRAGFLREFQRQGELHGLTAKIHDAPDDESRDAAIIDALEACIVELRAIAAEIRAEGVRHDG